MMQESCADGKKRRLAVYQLRNGRRGAAGLAGRAGIALLFDNSGAEMFSAVTGSRALLRSCCWCAAALLLLVGNAAAAELSFWVWNRTTPLSSTETEQLRALGVTELYWHAGELENRGGTWRWRRAPFAPREPAFRVVQVVRLDGFSGEPFSGSALESLLARLSDTGAVLLQVDADVPDRLLPQYASALQLIRETVPELTITALAGWSRSPHFEQLQSCVSELFPMFYDLEAESGSVGERAAPRPLLDANQLDVQLQSWSRCRIPWRAGLPNFARLTVFDTTGKSRGHIRSWRWEDVVFNRLLTPVAPATAGATLLRVDKDGALGATPLRSGEWIAARWVDRAALRRGMEAARANGARGVVLFRLPDRAAASGWSLPTLAQLDATPRLVLRQVNASTLLLVNDSPADLEPLIAGAAGGYALEIDAPAPIWREAEAGDFWRVTGHVNADTAPAAVAIPLASRLTFWFSHLRAGESLHTGLLQVAPGASLGAVRYRVLDAPSAEWQSIENAAQP
jgi:hypothetical protein